MNFIAVSISSAPPVPHWYKLQCKTLERDNKKIPLNQGVILVHLIGESWNRFHAEISKNARIIEGSGMLNLIKRAA